MTRSHSQHPHPAARARAASAAPDLQDDLDDEFARADARLADAGDDADDEGADRFRDEQFRGATRRPRTGAKRTLLGTIRQIPDYLRLLAGLLTDRRVSALDKLLVAGAAVYILTPIDFIPDVIPFLGEVDDIFVLVTALQRLVANAGRVVLLDHWKGDPEELGDLNLKRVVDAATFFLPGSLRSKLTRLVTRRVTHRVAARGRDR